jgi:hypothetical protein
MSLNLLTALRLLNGADYLRVLGTDQSQTLARLYLSGFDAYYIGLLFYGLASTACSYLFFKAGYIPKGLAGFGVSASAWAAACTLAFIISPAFAKVVNLWWFDSGLGIFELATGFWLVFKGLRREMLRLIEHGPVPSNHAFKQTCGPHPKLDPKPSNTRSDSRPSDLLGVDLDVPSCQRA